MFFVARVLRFALHLSHCSLIVVTFSQSIATSYNAAVHLHPYQVFAKDQDEKSLNSTIIGDMKKSFKKSKKKKEGDDNGDDEKEEGGKGDGGDDVKAFMAKQESRPLNYSNYIGSMSQHPSKLIATKLKPIKTKKNAFQLLQGNYFPIVCQ